MMTSKHCNHCGVLLVPGYEAEGGNWTPSRQRKRDYVCNPCNVSQGSRLGERAPSSPRTVSVMQQWQDEEIERLKDQAERPYVPVDQEYERIKAGYVYMIRQRDVHAVVKIGRSLNPMSRINSANTFLEPHREFILVKAWPAKDAEAAEAHVHATLAARRIANKELFRGNYEYLRDWVDQVMEDWYEDNQVYG